VSSVLASVTVFGAASVGVLQAYPGGGSAPGGLSMVFNGGVPATQLVALPLNADGQVELLSWFASIDVTIDVVGWNVAATGTWVYGYNPDGLRASKTPPAGSGIGATTFTWDRASGLPMLLAQDQAGVGATYFIYGPGGLPVEQINPDGTTLFLHHDQIGSTRTATDATGAAVATWSYDPYGNQAAHTGTIDVPLGYTGQYTDPETGLQYLRARYYDPATGTFLSRDPLNASTRSAYGYVYGDPLNNVDPSGLGGVPGGCYSTSDTPACNRARGGPPPHRCAWGVKGHRADGSEICNGAGDVADNLNPDKNYISQVWDHKLSVDYGTAFAGSYNFMTGGVRVLTGVGLVYASPACLVAAPICAGAGVVLIGWGGLKVRRGVNQWVKYNEDPHPSEGGCTVGDNVLRFVRGVTPWGSGEDIWDRLSGAG
jgi:RHS repeat-associated protein